MLCIYKNRTITGCKWVFKTKKDSLLKDSLRRNESTTRRPSLLYPRKIFFHIIMALVAHFNLELHQMDVKMVFLNKDLEEEVYMKQP